MYLEPPDTAQPHLSDSSALLRKYQEVQRSTFFQKDRKVSSKNTECFNPTASETTDAVWGAFWSRYFEDFPTKGMYFTWMWMHPTTHLKPNLVCCVENIKTQRGKEKEENNLEEKESTTGGHLLWHGVSFLLTYYISEYSVTWLNQLW